jgi:hypothetical protein
MSGRDQYTNNLYCQCNKCIYEHWKSCVTHKGNIIARNTIYNLIDKNTDAAPIVINKLTTFKRPSVGVKITNKSYIKKIKEEYDLIIEQLYRKRKKR